MPPVLGVAVGLALVLAGVRLGYLSARDAVGGRIGGLVRAFRRRPAALLAVGALGAALVHISSAVEVAVLALVQAGALGLDDGLFVILGANVGTTATAQLVALRLPGLGALAMGIGLAGALFGRRHALAIAVFSLGCFLQGLELLGESGAAAVGAQLARLSRAGPVPPAVGFGWGWLLTALVQSSTFVSSTLVTLVAAGIMEPAVAVAAVLGANVGTVTTGLLASLFVGRGARWLALADLALNLAGAGAAMAVFPWFYAALQRLAAGPAQVVAHAHTLFNVALVLLALPLVRPMARWLGSRPG